jgi:hypothetical protein
MLGNLLVGDGVLENIISKWTLEKQLVTMWKGFSCFKRGPKWKILVLNYKNATQNMFLNITKNIH